MIRFIVAGSLGYLEKGVSYLKQNGYIPEMVVEKSSRSDDSLENHLDEIRQKDVQLLACLAYPDILKKPILDLFPKGCINIHAGLPAYRGRHSLNWMLIDGVKEIPVAIHYMNEKIDAGDILVQDRVFVERDDDYKSVMDKITSLEQQLLLAAIKQIETDSVYRVKQNPAQLRYTRRRSPDDSAIDWTKSSEELTNFINALVDPMPNAFVSTEQGTEIKIRKAYRGKNVGEVLAQTTDGLYVISTRDGIIMINSDKDLSVGTRFKEAGK